MPRTARIEHQVSAGGVVYRETEGQLEVVLCGRKSPLLWALPKGTPDQGESIEQTALREVREETGLDAAIQTPLGFIEYWFSRTQDGVRCHKKVHFYLMVPTGGDPSLHDPEFDLVRWFAEQEALKAMSYASEVAIVKKALLAARGEFRPKVESLDEVGRIA
ncbi:MAG: NUDIX hydrolase [Dehalococcoidia bacterium]|nr:NUDIX hydrolase [Dehalococcoidia bacterium]